MPGIDHIVIVHDSVEARGGATGLARLSALEYRKRGHRVSYLTGETGDEELVAAGIEVLGLGQAKLKAAGALTALRKGFHNGDAQCLVSEWIAANDTPQTVYHLHNWSQILSPSVFTALKPVEARTIVSCHDFFNVCPNGGLLNFQSGKACNLKPMSAACWSSQCDRRSPLHKYWRMARHVRLNGLADFAHSDMTFVCLNSGMEQVMRDVGFAAPKLTNIPNPATRYTEARIEAEKNRPFLYVGRINKEKGADLAAQAANQAGVPLIMVGEGDLAAPLKASYPDIEFPGFCTRQQIVDFARQSRALLVPGRWREPFGLVIAEAAASGLPVLLSEPSTLAADIARLDMGRVFDPNAPEVLTAILTELATDDAQIERLSRNAFAHASEICSTTDEWIDGFLEIFARMPGLAS